MSSIQTDITQMDLAEIILLAEKNKKIGGRIFYPGSKYQIISNKIKKYYQKNINYGKIDFMTYLKNYQHNIIYNATKNKDFDVIKFYIDRNLGIITIKEFASYNGDISSLKYLFDQNKIDDVDDEMGYGKAMIHIAADNGQTNIVRFLIQKGADVNQIDEDGNTALHLANYDTTKMLLNVDGIDLDIVNDDGYTPLTWALEEDFEDIITILIEAGSKLSCQEFGDNIKYFYNTGKMNIVKTLVDYYYDGPNGQCQHLMSDPNIKHIIISTMLERNEMNISHHN